MKNRIFKKLHLLLAVTIMAMLTIANPAYSQTAEDKPAAEPAGEIKPAEVTQIPEQVPELSPFAQRLELGLAGAIMAVSGKAEAERFEAIVEHYRQNLFEPIWVSDEQLTQKARDAVNVLQNAHLHGLSPQDYDSKALSENLDAKDIDSLIDTEIRLTRSVVAYGQHLNAGKLDPLEVNPEIVVFTKVAESGKILENMRITKNIQVYLRLLAPHTPRYERLRTALANYKAIALNGGWTKIAEGEVLKPDIADPRILAVQKRMMEEGLVDQNTAQNEIYDEQLVEAVKKFQIRQGLQPDGVIGPQTLKQMNIPVEDRIRTMEINLERRRWMQNNYGRYYVFVNLADQTIKLVQDEKNLHFEIIQVGKPYFRTPVFNEVMEYVELNPYWNVPYSIATKEYLPKLKSNPGALNRENIRVLLNGKTVSASAVPWNSYSRRNFPFRLRQQPGPKNALGRVKFMFPNKFNVYIHDTPSKSKFKKASRYFSHGCLRLRDPLTMAEKILGAQGWSREKIDSVVRSGRRTVVKLKEKIPVHVTYLTAWVNKDGSVNFRSDIYGRDKILDQAMKKAIQG